MIAHARRRLRASWTTQSNQLAAPHDLTVLPPDAAAWFTIIVPTRNEEGSVRPLLSSLADSLDGIPAEVLFVDDSGDGTPEVIRQAARECGLAVRLLHRPAGTRPVGSAARWWPVSSTPAAAGRS